MIINKAILHVMVKQKEDYELSEQELFIDMNMNEYLSKNIEKMIQSSTSQKGTCKTDSNMYRLMENYETNGFHTISKEIATKFFNAYKEALRFEDINLLFIEYELDGILYFSMLKCYTKKGYVRNMEGHLNELVLINTLMPTASQQIDEYFIIHINTCDVVFKEHKKYFDGRESLLISDDILACSSELSTKDSLKVLDEIVVKVSNELEEDILENTLKMKQFVKSCMETDKQIDVKDVAEVVYSHNPKFKDRVQDLIEEKQVPNTIELQAKAPVAMRKHKIKSDTGIEISVPIELMDAKDVLEIKKNSDGTVSIVLNHIGKIIN